MSDDETKKKKFNPFLSPTESEDEPKLDEEEEVLPAPSEEEAEEEQDYEEGGEIIVEQPVEEVYEEELIDEMTAQAPEKNEALKVVEPKEQKPRSWSFYALGLLIVLVACDWLAQSMGHAWFWTPRAIYIMSYVLRACILLIAAYAWHRSVFRDNRSAFRAVFMWLGLISGLILAVLRFMSEPSFWAFINMVVEPLDSTLLAVITWYIVIHLTTKLKLIKQTV